MREKYKSSRLTHLYMARSCYSYPGLRSLLRIPLHRDDAIRWWAKPPMFRKKKVFFYPIKSLRGSITDFFFVGAIDIIYVFRVTITWRIQKNGSWTL